MPNSLIIVESPTKARTIQRILGSDYEILASMGHVRDLPKTKLGVEPDEGFEPHYIVIRKNKALPQLRKAAKKADVIYLAPDPDREGEAIAWHIKEALGLEDSRVKRVTFHEITPRAVKKAFKEAGSIDPDKVYAQQARRILDRLVGYKISPLLWKKITKGLSAGRVQSVALRLICEREADIEAFVPEEYWRVAVRFNEPGKFEATCKYQRYAASDACPHCGGPLVQTKSGRRSVLACKTCAVDFRPQVGSGCLLGEPRLDTEEAARKVVDAVAAEPFVATISRSRESRSRSLSPFNTSLMQQSANIVFGFSASRTMRIAQQLYEGVELGSGEAVGLITYMRTDSFRCAPEAVKEARKFLKDNLGADYVPKKAPSFRRQRGAQEAHEAIRPTSVLRRPEDVKSYLDRDQYRLYDLIWRRFMASQTELARYLDRRAELTADGYVFAARGRTLVFDGATRFWPPQGELQSLPDLEEGQSLTAAEVVPSQHFTQPPPRYTEASLVRTLEREGIGRPSTYATIISTLSRRGYVMKRRRRFHPTELGRMVTDKLVRHFPDVMNVGFTADMEKRLDEIEEAKHDWREVLEDFWSGFRNELERAQENMVSVKGEVYPGVECPECGSPMVIRYSRRGKFLGCQRFPECRGTKSLPGPDGEEDTRPKSQPVDEVCPECGEGLMLRHSRRGAFIGCSGFPKCRYTRSIDEEDMPASREELSESGGENGEG